MAAFTALFYLGYLIPENHTPLYYKEESGPVYNSSHPYHCFTSVFTQQAVVKTPSFIQDIYSGAIRVKNTIVL
jgi:hypothetical protein